MTDKLTINCSKCNHKINININQLKEDVKKGLINSINININKIRREIKDTLITDVNKTIDDIKKIKITKKTNIMDESIKIINKLIEYLQRD